MSESPVLSPSWDSLTSLTFEAQSWKKGSKYAVCVTIAIATKLRHAKRDLKQLDKPPSCKWLPQSLYIELFFCMFSFSHQSWSTQGDNQETGIYHALSRVPRLKRAFLNLRFSMGPNRENGEEVREGEPPVSTESGGEAIHFVYLREAFSNSAIVSVGSCLRPSMRPSRLPD
jgi:hypothetical protein